MVLYELVVIEKTYVMSIMFMNLSESRYFNYSGHCVYKVRSLIFLMWSCFKVKGLSLKCKH